MPKRNSTSTFVYATPEKLASVAECLLDLNLSGEGLTLATIEVLGQPPIYVLMSGTFTGKRKGATDMAQAALLTIESGSSKDLAKTLLKRLNQTNPPSTTPSPT